MNIELGPIAIVEEVNARRALYEIDARDTVSDLPISILVDCLRADLEQALRLVRERCAAVGNAWPSICQQVIALLHTEQDAAEQLLYLSPDNTKLDAITPADLILAEIAFTFDDSRQLDGLNLDCRLRDVMTRVYVEDDLSVFEIDFGD